MNSPHIQEIMLAAIAGTILFFLLTAFCISYIVIYRKKKRKHTEELHTFKRDFQQQLLQSQVEVQEQTYSALSKELHDNIGQLLSTSRMLLGLTERDLVNPPDTLLTANATLAQAISELRSLSKSLDNDWLRQFSFMDNISAETERTNKAGCVIQADLNALEQLQLASDEQLILFRIVQEGIQNALKHARPGQITLTATAGEGSVTILIRDDGGGFQATEQPGMGITNMKHRSTLLGGHINWLTAPGQGTTIQLILPLKRNRS